MVGRRVYLSSRPKQRLAMSALFGGERSDGQLTVASEDKLNDKKATGERSERGKLKDN